MNSVMNLGTPGVACYSGEPLASSGQSHARCSGLAHLNYKSAFHALARVGGMGPLAQQASRRRRNHESQNALLEACAASGTCSRLWR